MLLLYLSSFLNRKIPFFSKPTRGDIGSIESKSKDINSGSHQQISAASSENQANALTHELQPLFPPRFSQTYALASARARGGPNGHQASAHAITSGNQNVAALAHARASGPNQRNTALAHAQSGRLHNTRVLAHARANSYSYG